MAHNLVSHKGGALNIQVESLPAKLVAFRDQFAIEMIPSLENEFQAPASAIENLKIPIVGSKNQSCRKYMV